MVQATATNRMGLEGAGYRITEMIGFKDHALPLYTHKDVSDKKRGDVAFTARVGDPRHFNDGEANYLARKAAEGFFPWKPDECMNHKFRNVTYGRDGLGRTTMTKAEPVLGCKWCREMNVTAPVVPEPVAVAPVKIVEKATAVAAVEPCSVCGWKPAAGVKRVAFALSVHKRSHVMRPNSPTAEAVPSGRA